MALGDGAKPVLPRFSLPFSEGCPSLAILLVTWQGRVALEGLSVPSLSYGTVPLCLSSGWEGPCAAPRALALTLQSQTSPAKLGGPCRVTPQLPQPTPSAPARPGGLRGVLSLTTLSLKP